MGHSAKHEKQRDVRAGLVCAEAFQRLSEPLISEIGHGLREGRQEPSAGFGDVVASAANLAFALELYLKTLLAQKELPVPEHHNLRELYDVVSLPAKEEIQKRYDTTWRSEWNGKRASITFAKGPTRPAHLGRLSREAKGHSPSARTSPGLLSVVALCLGVHQAP